VTTNTPCSAYAHLSQSPISSMFTILGKTIVSFASLQATKTKLLL
jgi:hypothetical protein